MVNYNSLYEWLKSKANAGEEKVETTFGEIEEILDGSLPKSARKSRPWWGNDKTHAQARAWMVAGWKVDHANLNSERVIFEQLGVPFIQLTGASDRIEKSEGHRITICPDACVLLQMVRTSSGLSSIRQLDKWLKQMNQCKALLNRDDIDWVIPEQVTREFKKNKEDENKKGKNKKGEFSSIRLFRKGLISTANISDKKLDIVNNRLSDAVLELETLARQNQKRIMDKSLVLSEKNEDYKQRDFIHDAWCLVYSDKFPNQEKQQMKDSVILSHLLALSRENDGIVSLKFPIYFWTFDKFDDAPNSQFPEEASREFIKIISDIEAIRYKSLKAPTF